MKVIALDVDGVLREKHWEAGKPQILIPATAQKLWAMQSPTICISNQAGCYWGYSTIATKIAEFRWLMGRLPIQRCYFCPDYGSTGIWGLNQTQTLSGIETKYITPSILVPIASLNQTQTLSGIETVSCSAFWLSTDAVSTKPKPSQGLKPLPCGVGSRIWTIVSTKPKPSQGLKLNTDTV